MKGGGDVRDGEVPRLPRGSFFKLSGPQLFRIGLVAILFVAVITLRHQCGESVAGLISSFDPPPDAGPAAPGTGMQLERLTEDEIKRRFPGGEDDAGSAPTTPSDATAKPAPAPAPASAPAR